MSFTSKMASEKVEKVKTSHGQWCSAINCTNSRKKKKFSFFRFPLDPERSKRWVLNTKREDLLKKTAKELFNSNVLCAEHFEQSQFRNPSKKNRLISNAVPTIFAIPNPPKSITPSRPIPVKRKLNKAEGIPKPHEQQKSKPSTSQHAELSPQKKRLKKTIKIKQQQIRRLKQKSTGRLHALSEASKAEKLSMLSELMSEFISGPAIDFFMCQMRMSIKKGNARRWSSKDKSFALTLYHCSPKAYKLLRKLNFSLPSVCTLKRILRNIDIYPGFSSRLLEAFKIKVKGMGAQDKLCAVLFDEMSIKESLVYNSEYDFVEGFEDLGILGRTRSVANHATVFMARGLLTKWKQPFGYFLSSGPIKHLCLKDLLLHSLDHLQRIGLDVKVVICDQGTNNRAALTSLGMSTAAPFFHHDDKRYIVLFDPPHLLKNVRNNLKHHGFRWDDNVATWDHIQQFYNIDIQNPLRMAPKLTARHIYLPPFSPLRVSLAAQVLSHSVAMGISFLCQVQLMPVGAMATSQFLSRFDNLFNVFNVSSIRSNSPYKNAITANSKHHSFLEEMFSWLDVLKHGSSDKKLPCVSGWQQNIKSFALLWDDLNANYQVKFMLTNRLNQDCLENLFSIVRGQGGHRDNPNASQLRAGLRQVMVDMVLLPSPRQNCKEDIDFFVCNLQQHKSSEGFALQTRRSPDVPEGMTCLLSECSSLSLQEDNILAYIGGYIVKKGDKFLCQECIVKISSTGTDLSSPSYAFLSTKQYDQTAHGGLKIPNEELLNFLRQMEMAYKEIGTDILHSDRVRSQICGTLKSRLLPSFNSFNCSESGCRPFEFILNMYVTIRLHHSLRLSNVEFVSSRAKKRKLVKLSHH